MSRPDDICACGHPRSLHTLDQVQRFTDGSARRRSCSESIYDGWKGTAWVCMCDYFMRPLGGPAEPACGYCYHPRGRHAPDGCHATTDGPPWRPGSARCSCDQFPGEPSLRRWTANQVTQPHARCARAGRCLEHAANRKVEPCR